jgi:hypothetical protein
LVNEKSINKWKVQQSKVVEEQKQQIAQLETKLLRFSELLNLTKQKHNETNSQLIHSNVLLQNTVNDQQKLISNLRNEKEELQIQLGKAKSENLFLSSQLRFLKVLLKLIIIMTVWWCAWWCTYHYCYFFNYKLNLDPQ